MTMKTSRRALRADLPPAVAVDGLLMFQPKAVEHWELRKRAEFLLEVTS